MQSRLSLVEPEGLAVGRFPPLAVTGSNVARCLAESAAWNSKRASVQMNDELYGQYRRLDTDELIELRGCGDAITDDAHSAIESVLAERGVEPPPRPSRPVDLGIERAEPKENGAWMIWVGAVLVCLLVSALAETLVRKIFQVSAAGFVSLALTSLGALVIYRILMAEKAAIRTPEERLRARIGQNGFTELMCAAALGEIDRLKELLTYGANVNSVDHDGATALMRAARSGHAEAVDLILRAGARPQMLDRRRMSALDYARRHGHVEAAALLERAANVSSAA